MPVLIVTVGWSGGAALLDISATGARLGGKNLPSADQGFVLKINKVEAFATVAWVADHMIGIAFDEPLQDGQVRALQQEVRDARLTGLTPDEQLAMQDWSVGVAR
jgi:hypothetical protein